MDIQIGDTVIIRPGFGMEPPVEVVVEGIDKKNADHPGDIIADILHWCDHYNEDFVDLLRIANNYYHDEIKEKEVDTN